MSSGFRISTFLQAWQYTQCKNNCYITKCQPYWNSNAFRTSTVMVFFRGVICSEEIHKKNLKTFQEISLYTNFYVYSNNKFTTEKWNEESHNQNCKTSLSDPEDSMIYPPQERTPTQEGLQEVTLWILP